MAILTILQYPDPRLRIKAAPVTNVDADLRKKIDDMFETMYDSRGIGLAATQVDIHLQMLTIDISRNESEPICILNPEIIHKEGTQFETEGCLSFTDAFARVERALKVKVRGFDLDMQPIELEGEGLLAAAMQHELDHLQGVLFIDHLSKLKQDRVRQKLEKNNRRASS